MKKKPEPFLYTPEDVVNSLKRVAARDKDTLSDGERLATLLRMLDGWELALSFARKSQS